jgi:16S rRNA (guanine1207-N2)-methyltransferase
MEHYFTGSPTSPAVIKIVEDTVRGRNLRFKTSSGVFSKDKIDNGTRLLAETVHVQSSTTVLDIGCGYGAIGICLSFFCHFTVLIDINERACTLARENIVLNHVRNGYVVRGTPSCLDYTFDVVAMNPPIRAGKKVVFHLIEESRRLLTQNGNLYIVVRTRQGAKSIYSFVQERFSHAEYAALKGGYRVIEGMCHWQKKG